ncbi:MAG TPA: rRNA maturation RNase YbeY [Gemmataceae bacterium]|jgi:probable rRNA maturation factor|nr:rRNA maturation RNase YbeY [Gemmataceae bacterium]
MIGVSVASPQELVALEYQRLKDCARAVLAGEGVTEAKIVLAFVDDATIAGLNKRFLEHEGPTDVITFPYSGKAKKLEGEVVIGVEVATREAAERGHDVNMELCLYVIHGILHLCGYDDRSKKDAAEMRVKERVYLRQLNLPDIVDE